MPSVAESPRAGKSAASPKKLRVHVPPGSQWVATTEHHGRISVTVRGMVPTDGNLAPLEWKLMVVVARYTECEGAFRGTKLQLAKELGLEGKNPESIKQRIKYLLNGRTVNGVHRPSVVERGWMTNSCGDPGAEAQYPLELVATDKWFEFDSRQLERKPPSEQADRPGNNLLPPLTPPAQDPTQARNISTAESMPGRNNGASGPPAAADPAPQPELAPTVDPNVSNGANGKPSATAAEAVSELSVDQSTSNGACGRPAAPEATPQREPDSTIEPNASNGASGRPAASEAMLEALENVLGKPLVEASRERQVERLLTVMHQNGWEFGRHLDESLKPQRRLGWTPEDPSNLVNVIRWLEPEIKAALEARAPRARDDGSTSSMRGEKTAKRNPAPPVSSEDQAELRRLARELGGNPDPAASERFVDQLMNHSSYAFNDKRPDETREKLLGLAESRRDGTHPEAVLIGGLNKSFDAKAESRFAFFWLGVNAELTRLRACETARAQG